jgi:hypothetical protein
MHPMMNGEEELNAHLLRNNHSPEPKRMKDGMTSCTYVVFDMDEQEKLEWLVEFMGEHLHAKTTSLAGLYKPKEIVKYFADKMPSKKTILDYLRTEHNKERIDYLLDILFYMKYKDKFIFRFL